MAIVLFDTEDRKSLYPFTYTRSVADMRLGILTIKEWWEIITKQKVFVLTKEYLQNMYPSMPEGKHFFIHSQILTNVNLLKRILLLSVG
ncbi:MAG: glucose-1-phosphate thymidylyltransferase, partial [Pseudopedobacter saltans]